MVTNRFWNRVGLLVLMFMLYGIGIAVGRDEASLAHHQHPICNPNLKP